MSTELTTPIKIEIPGIGTIESADLYIKSEVDAAIAELKRENERLKKQSSCTFSEDCLRVRRLRAENRRMKRALYKACANWAHHRVFVRYKTNEKAWENVERKCRAMEEKYK